MLDSIAALTPPDPDFPQRTARLALYKRVQDGTLYDALPYEFQDERNSAGEYIPLRYRRPSVRYPLARIVIDDSVSLVFGDGHFPQIETDDPALRTALADIAAECRLNATMQEAALCGAVGSVAILLRVLKGRVFLKVMATIYLTPRWQADAPDTLESVVEKYKVPGATLVQMGYDVDPQALHWFMRVWDHEAETWFQP